MTLHLRLPKKQNQDGHFEDGDDVIHPRTLRGFLCPLQQVFKTEVGVANLILFKMERVMCVVDYKIKESQRKGRVLESQNVDSISDVEKFFEYLAGVLHTP